MDVYYTTITQILSNYYQLFPVHYLTSTHLLPDYTTTIIQQANFFYPIITQFLPTYYPNYFEPFPYATSRDYSPSEGWLTLYKLLYI